MDVILKHLLFLIIYDNPRFIGDKQVLKIEEAYIRFDCMIIAVGPQYVWQIENELNSHDINKLVIVHPIMYDEIYGRI